MNRIVNRNSLFKGYMLGNKIAKAGYQSMFYGLSLESEGALWI
jgi:hypothetical protein